jgi:peptidoglycan/xylan/chitin deacetylase (PgdA/CDA1 family)
VVAAPRRKVTVEELRAHWDEIEKIGRWYGIGNIRVFGRGSPRRSTTWGYPYGVLSTDKHPTGNQRSQICPSFIHKGDAVTGQHGSQIPTSWGPVRSWEAKVLADRASRVTNLTVSGVGPHTGELSSGEAATWIDIEQLEQVLDLALERPTVRLSFDGGHYSDVHIALPRLVERGLTAEFFPLAGRIGDSGRIDRSGLRELVAAGMSIGSHGWEHRDWRALDDDAAEQEIGLALRVLTAVSGQPVDRVSVPFGSYDRTVLRRLRRAGVTRAYTSDGGWARVDAWLQPRTSLRADMTPERVHLLADGRTKLGPLRALRLGKHPT